MQTFPSHPRLKPSAERDGIQHWDGKQHYHCIAWYVARCSIMLEAPCYVTHRRNDEYVTQPCRALKTPFSPSHLCDFSDEARCLFPSEQDTLPANTSSLLSQRNAACSYIQALQGKLYIFAVIAFRFPVYQKERKLVFLFVAWFKVIHPPLLHFLTLLKSGVASGRTLTWRSASLL